MLDPQSTEGKILEAAQKVFQKKGLAGARMQDIADEAGINKALLHYYFRSKEKLFELVLEDAMGRVIPPVVEIWESEGSLHEKIERFVTHYITVMTENKYIPQFVIHELAQNQNHVKHLLHKGLKPPKDKIFAQIQAAVQRGEIRPIQPIELMLNLISLCLFPIIAQDLIKGMMEIPDELYEAMLQQRKQSIIQFIYNALRPDVA